MSRTRHTCTTCAHYGCCADLHHCGGMDWTPAEDEDGGERDDREDWTEPLYDEYGRY